MQIIFGELSMTGLTSTLLPQNAWLLLGGYPDPAQAGRAATNYILNIKHIASGPVAVTGIPTTVGTQPAIVMSDINKAGGLEVHAPEAMLPAGKKNPKKASSKR